MTITKSLFQKFTYNSIQSTLGIKQFKSYLLKDLEQFEKLIFSIHELFKRLFNQIGFDWLKFEIWVIVQRILLYIGTPCPTHEYEY